MLYPRINRNKKSFFSKKILYSVVFVVLCSLGIFFSRVQNISRFFASPIWSAENSVIYGFSSFLNYFKSKSSLANQNQILKDENARLYGLILEADSLRKENEYFKKILGREEIKNTILATVLVKPNKSLYDTLIIDIGSNQGVLPGNIVFANGEIEIGVISSVYKKSSIVTLYSSPKYKSSVIFPETNMTIDLEGTGGGGFYFIVPRDVVINEGTIFTSLSLMPHPVAIVGKIVSSQRDSFKKIIAHSPINIQELRFVEVELSS